MSETIPLGELVEIKGGGTPSRSVAEYWGGSVPWATVKDFKSTNLEATLESITNEGVENSSTNIVPAGSIIVPTRMAVGKAAISTVDLAINQDLKALLPNDDVDRSFLLYFLLSKADYLEGQAQGATVKGIKLDILRSLEFPRLPISEQRRIAEILDKASDIRLKREDALTKADDLIQAAFLEMFGDPVTNRHGFRLGTIRDLLAEARYGTSKKASEREGEFPVLRMGNITYSGTIDISDLKYLDLKESEKQKYLLKKGDILFNRTNSADLVGKTAVFDLDGDFTFAGYLVRSRTNENDADPYFISGYLNSKHGKSVLRSMCKSIIGMANINAQEFQNIKIMIPPLSLQKQYRQIVKGVSKHKALLNRQLVEGNQLFYSLSSRAFRGEL